MRLDIERFMRPQHFPRIPQIEGRAVARRFGSRVRSECFADQRAATRKRRKAQEENDKYVLYAHIHASAPREREVNYGRLLGSGGAPVSANSALIRAISAARSLVFTCSPSPRRTAPPSGAVQFGRDHPRIPGEPVPAPPLR